MSRSAAPVDVKAAEEHLMRFLAVEGVTGEEACIAAVVSEELVKVGVPASAIRFDTANKRIPLPTQTGNLIVDLPGTRSGSRLLFATHLDTVPLCAGAKPRREGVRIVSDGKTALGGDNRTGCAVLVTLAETLLKHKLPHPPITLLFTVREESGLHGSRELDPADLGGATMGFNVDGKLAGRCLYRNLPDRGGTYVDGGGLPDEATSPSVHPAFVLPQTNDDIRIEQQPHLPIPGFLSPGESGPFSIKSRISSGSGASIAAATSSLITPLRVPNLNFFGSQSSSGTSFAMGMPDLAMITALPLAA